MKDTETIFGKFCPKNNRLAIILFISILSALFMPVIISFYGGFLALIAFYILCFTQKCNVKKYTVIFIVVIAGMLVTGILYLLAYFFFIEIFPTFVILLTTLWIMQLVPYSFSKMSKFFIFIIISSFFGLNTLLVQLVVPVYKIEENIGNKLVIKDLNAIYLSSNAPKIPYTNNTYDFLSHDVFKYDRNDEDNSKLKWRLPKRYFEDTIFFFDQLEIPYTFNISPHEIKIEYNEIEQGIYHLSISVISNNEILSKLDITDRLLPNRDNEEGTSNSLHHRFEFLQKHNLWHYLVFLYKSNQPSVGKVIKNFLNQSIVFEHELYREYTVKAMVIQESNTTIFPVGSKEHLIYINTRDQDTKSFKLPNSNISLHNKDNGDIIFDINNSFFSILSRKKVNHDLSQGGYLDYYRDNGFVTDKYIYLLRAHDDNQMSLWQFSKKGFLLSSISFEFSKSIALDETSIGFFNRIKKIENIYINNGLLYIQYNEQTDEKKTKDNIYKINNNIKYYVFDIKNDQNIEF